MGPPGPADFQTQIEINMGFTMGSTEGRLTQQNMVHFLMINHFDDGIFTNLVEIHHFF
jgi:hypothetical protein